MLFAGLGLSAQPYNNEWIDFSKTYYKFKVGSEDSIGFHKRFWHLQASATRQQNIFNCSGTDRKSQFLHRFPAELWV